MAFRASLFASLGLGLLGVVAGCAATSSEPAAAETSDLSMAELPVMINDYAEGTFEQKLDHADPASRTFKQRYWYSTQFAKGPDAPVLLVFGGESEAGPGLVVGRGDVAKTLGAAVVVLEHRYYGKSLAFDDPTPADMKYLSIDAALKDAAEFENFAKTTLHLSGKWIAIGGSYSGMLAAFYRAKYPANVVGAWASSAPVDMQLVFSGADEVTAKALGSDCLKLHRTMMKEASDIFEDDAKRSDLMKRVGRADGYPIPDGVDAATRQMFKRSFLSFFGSVPRSAAQRDNLHAYCSALAQHPDPIDGFVGYVNAPLVDEGNETPAAPAVAPPLPPPVAGHLGTNNLVMWRYQMCTEVGFNEVANPNRELSVMSDLALDATLQIGDCERLFGAPSTDTQAARTTYFDPIKNGQASNILFVNGTNDPWSALSFDDPSTAPSGVTVHVVALGTHTQDLQPLYPSSLLGVFEAHKTFHDLALQWLAQP